MSVLNLVFIILGIVLIVIAAGMLFAVNPFKHPHPTESDLSYAQLPFYLYYSSRYLFPVKRAEKGSNLERLFKETSKPEKGGLSNLRSLSLRFTGDLMYRRDNIPPESPGLWTEVAPYLTAGDIKAGNLEFAVNSEMTFEKLIRFSIPPEKAEHMININGYGRFDVLFTANNHINDSYFQGITSTNDYLDSLGITHVGANRGPEEADRIPVIEKNGIKVAFLAYSFSTNGIPMDQGREYGVNLVRFNALSDRDYDPSMIYRHIRSAREKGAEFVVVSCHWGVEFHYYPFKQLVERAHGIMDEGADVIIGHHPHILNPAEWYRTKDGRNALCCYSLANITGAGLLRSYHHLSEVVSIDLEKGEDQDGRERVRIGRAEIMPTFYIRSSRKGIGDNHIVPLFEACNRIRRGDPYPWLKPRHKRTLLRMEKEFMKHFYQEGFEYV